MSEIDNALNIKPNEAEIVLGFINNFFNKKINDNESNIMKSAYAHTITEMMSYLTIQHSGNDLDDDSYDELVDHIRQLGDPCLIADIENIINDINKLNKN